MTPFYPYSPSPSPFQVLNKMGSKLEKAEKENKNKDKFYIIDLKISKSDGSNILSPGGRYGWLSHAILQPCQYAQTHKFQTSRGLVDLFP